MQKLKKKIKGAPTIAVLMPIYAGTDPIYFAEALRSVFIQTHLADEYVIVFDGPVPTEINTIISDLSKDLKIKNVKKIRYSQNMGLGYALYRGVISCKSDFIMRMDDDDISLPNRIERQLVSIMTYPHIDVFGGQIIEFGMNYPPQLKPVPQTHKEIKRMIGLRNMINPVTVCMRRNAVLGAGNYDPNSNAGFEDYELWHRLLAKGCLFFNLPDPLVLVRFKEPQLSRRSGFSYLLAELRMHYKFLSEGYTSFWVFFVSVVLRLIARLIPIFILKFAYMHILRQPLTKEYENLFWSVMDKNGNSRRKVGNLQE